jgi:hypothetical protein
MGLRTTRIFCAWVAAVMAGVNLPATFAVAITVPNGSFESPPATDVSLDPTYALPFFGLPGEAWQHPAMPGYYALPPYSNNASGWLTTAGVFYDKFGLVDNLTGPQGGFFFAAPLNRLSQNLAQTYQEGKSYHLSFDAEGGGLGMTDGTQMELELYYLDGNNNPVTISSVVVTNHNVGLLYLTHLDAYPLDLPAVQAGDAWRGKTIGIAIASLTDVLDTGHAAGYWDVDNVQLTELPEPASLGILGLGVLGMCLRRRNA